MEILAIYGLEIYLNMNWIEALIYGYLKENNHVTMRDEVGA